MIIFDGKKFASDRELLLARAALKLREKGIYPKLAAILIGENESSEKYIKIKKQTAELVGCEVDDYKVSVHKDYQQVLHLIRFLNEDDSIHGIMIQLPLPETWKKHQQKFIDLIDPAKDVDGHKENSKFLPATVKAVVNILQTTEMKKTDKIMVVGSKGEVGSRLIKYLESQNYDVSGCDKVDFQKNFDKNADVLISATGKENLITEELVKDGAIVIDVGYPNGDVDFKTVSKKTSFITPVPGGVGPVTVISLMENLITAAEFAKR